MRIREAARECVLWLVFFGICVGLGYPTLNRYDPRNTGGLSDTNAYYELTAHGPEHASEQLKYRVLIPLLARPIARAASGYIGSWDPIFFGLLIVNSFFTATTAWLLVVVARRLVEGESAALLAAALYLLNFETANVRLSGMVDSAEGCFLMALVWTLLSGRFALLALWGVLGALAKETFVPLCIAFSVVWWWVAPKRRENWFVAVVPSLAALGSITALQSIVSGHVMMPWQFAAALHTSEGHLDALYHNVVDQNLLYCFIWLLPLGMPRLNRLPAPWLAACGGATLMIFILVTWHSSSPGASARPLFSVAGPLLSLAAAMNLGRSRQVISAEHGR